MIENDPKRARGRPRTMDADAVVDVAIDSYWCADPADVSINSICQRAGISKPSLYREFGSEDGLTRAVLERYADRVLSEIFVILARQMDLRPTLDALIAFAASDPQMSNGCLFYKMRAGKHRLGPETRAKVEEIDAAAEDTFNAFLKDRRDAGELAGTFDDATGAQYLVEQLGLAFAQRAAGNDPDQVRRTLTLALSVFGP